MSLASKSGVGYWRSRRQTQTRSSIGTRQWAEVGGLVPVAAGHPPGVVCNRRALAGNRLGRGLVTAGDGCR